jgi:hypothetical protein
VFFRLLFGAKRECRHFPSCGEETQIPPHNVADYLTRSVRRASGFVLAENLTRMSRGCIAKRKIDFGMCLEHEKLRRLPK